MQLCVFVVPAIFSQRLLVKDSQARRADVGDGSFLEEFAYEIRQLLCKDLPVNPCHEIRVSFSRRK